MSANTADGQPCCEWVGPEGAGHFVNMVHNGIEYGDMQLIAEVYHIMKSLLGLSHDRMSEIFDRWNRGKLGSYLIEITRDILAYKDEDGSPLVEKILDAAGQKGTGKWTGIEALDHGVPVHAHRGRGLRPLPSPYSRTRISTTPGYELIVLSARGCKLGL